MADSRISNQPLSARMHARSTGSREQSINFLLDHSALEEIRIHPCVQLDRVNEHEVAKIFLSDEPLFDQFPRLGRGVTHVEQVAMTDVGTEDHVEAHVERIVLRVERPCGNVVVALASEEEAGHEEVTDIRGLPDCATRELVEIGRVFGRTPLNVANFVGAGWKLVGEPRAAVLAAKFDEEFAVQVFGIEVIEDVDVVHLPVADKVTVQNARPSDAALLEGELESRKTPRHAAEEKRLANGLRSRSEMADVVVHEVRNRTAKTDAGAGRMERWSDAKLDALRPYRVVIVVAVECEHVEPA